LGRTSLAKAFDVGGMVLTTGGYGRAVALGGSLAIDAPVAFASGGALMSVQGVQTGSAGADFGASLGLKIARHTTAYDARLRDNYTSQAFTAGIKAAW